VQLCEDDAAPVASKPADRVETPAGAVVRVAKTGSGCPVEASLPLSSLGLTPAKGL